MSPIYLDSGFGDFLNLATGQRVSSFVSGVTQPFYVETANLDGAKNVGAFGQMTENVIAPNASGIVQITSSGLYKNIIFRHPTEVRVDAQFDNCMWIVPPSWLFARPFAVLNLLNGSAANVEFNNVEIHNRAQRPMNGIQGRNFVMRKSVITGAIDPFSESSGGSFPIVNNRGFEVYDSVVPSIAFWYSNPNNVEIHNPDTGSHSDVYQSNTTLDVLLDNNTLAAYVSDFIGTGTPGSGSETNGYNPPSGNDFIVNQAQMEAWRAQFTTLTTASQTMGGVQRRLQLDGSQAGIMLNKGNVTARHNWFGGGTVGINAATGSIDPATVHLIDNIFWNDMLNGTGSRTTNPLLKGNAIFAAGTHVFGTETGNRWAPQVGGQLLARVSESGFGVWR